MTPESNARLPVLAFLGNSLVTELERLMPISSRPCTSRLDLMVQLSLVDLTVKLLACEFSVLSR